VVQDVSKEVEVKVVQRGRGAHILHPAMDTALAVSSIRCVTKGMRAPLRQPARPVTPAGGAPHKDKDS
jgi:hypothetical protein